MNEPSRELATFGGGCFWCTEAVFHDLRGVSHVESGYAGGQTEAPTYQEVCSGTTGHAEVIQVTFDPAEISYETLLDVFFHTHDPTTLNRQGADVGTQYRSVIFYHDATQQTTAVAVKERLQDSDEFSSPIVTEISPLESYYSAEAYHQRYFELNPRQPYCAAVVGPKVQKFRQRYQALLKQEA